MQAYIYQKSQIGGRRDVWGFVFMCPIQQIIIQYQDGFSSRANAEAAARVILANHLDG